MNWGVGHHVEGLRLDGKMFNHPANIAVASNKLSTFRKLKDGEGVRIPDFTTDRNVAYEWLRKDGVAVVARTQLNGHSGVGIVLVSDKDAEIPQAPLYVKYVKKEKEFRVHVAFGEVIDVQEKRQRGDVPEGFVRDFQVRNHHTGWVYCRENIEEPGGMRGMAIEAVKQIGLDFGAVDIIYNRKQDACYVLEINSAPGIEGKTVDIYANAFIKQIRGVV